MKGKKFLKSLVAGMCVLSAQTWLCTATAAPITWNGWTFDYEIGVNNEGLALKNVKYQTHVLLKKISLPAIRSGALSLPGVSCNPDYWDNIDSSLTPMPWANNATVSQRQFSQFGRQWYEIGIYKTIQDREYFQAYYLSNDGLFDAHLYTRGGFVCPDRELRIPLWRVDTDIDGAASDLLETTNGVYPNFKALTTEFTDGYFSTPFNPNLQPIKRARDTVTNASAALALTGLAFNHPDGNPTQAPSLFQQLFDYHTEWFDSGALYKPAEDSGIPLNSGVYVFLNSENINSKDVVYWYENQITPMVDSYFDVNPINPNKWYTSSMKLVPNWSQPALPDIVVDDFIYDFDGNFDDDGNFTVTLSNIGSVATPNDQSVGAGIYVDGLYKTWVSVRQLLPGETRTVKTTALARAYLQGGNHTITVWTNDLSRFAESHTDNNKTIKSVVIPFGPKVKITAPSASSTVSGASAVLSARLGDVTGLTGGVNFYVDGVRVANKYSYPYTVTWNSNAVAEGWHNLTATAFSRVTGQAGDSVLFKVVRDAASLPPDLAVTALNYANGVFSCTIKNVGAGPVPTQSSISFAYYVDGVYKTWTATTGPIAPGEIRNLGTSGSPYTIPAGNHTIKVIADDQGALAESNESNNTLSKSIAIP